VARTPRKAARTATAMTLVIFMKLTPPSTLMEKSSARDDERHYL